MVNATTEIKTDLMAEEERLVAEVRRDRGAFVRLYDRYLTPVYRYLLSRVGNRQDAEDLTSQVFLAALEHFEQYQGRGKSFAAWLFTIARNKTVDFFRTRHPDLPLDELAHYARRPAPSIARGADGEAETILRAVQELPPEEREVLNLRFAAQMTYAEIAGLLDRSEQAVKKQVYRLLKRIESTLEENHA